MKTHRAEHASDSPPCLVTPHELKNENRKPNGWPTSFKAQQNTLSPTVPAELAAVLPQPDETQP